MLLPCGIDATADWALGVGLGKFTVIVGHPGKGERSPCHLWADFFCDDINEAALWLQANKDRISSMENLTPEEKDIYNFRFERACFFQDVSVEEANRISEGAVNELRMIPWLLVDYHYYSEIQHDGNWSCIATEFPGIIAIGRSKTSSISSMRQMIMNENKRRIREGFDIIRPEDIPDKPF